jgi:Uma2 family endonuclease
MSATLEPPRLPIRLNGTSTIPAWVRGLSSFRKWARSDEFLPAAGRFAFLNGLLWADVTMEQLFTHNRVKTRVSSALDRLVGDEELGYFFSDRALLSHPEAGLSTEPDAFFTSYESVEAGRVRWVEGATEGHVEVEGSPDLTVEVVITGSIEKDTVLLPELYFAAGVREYWIVDARSDRATFDLFRRGRSAFVATRRLAGGWLKSGVLGRSFRLVVGTDRLRRPKYELEVK